MWAGVAAEVLAARQTQSRPGAEWSLSGPLPRATDVGGAASPSVGILPIAHTDSAQKP